MNKEQLAEQYAEGKSSSSVFQEAHKKDFLAGYEAGQPKWISVDEQLPKLNQQVMIKFIKGKQIEIVTQGCMKNIAKEIADSMQTDITAVLTDCWDVLPRVLSWAREAVHHLHLCFF